MWKRDWQEFGEKDEWSTFMIVECELQPWAQVANVDSLVVATIDIAPEATMLTAIELLRSFAMAAQDMRGDMRCLSEWTEAFLRDGGVARTKPI